MCEDVVLDTNALRLLLELEYVERIVDCCDRFYVTKNSLWKEWKGVRGGFQILYTTVRKLQSDHKLKDVPVSRIKLLPKIKSALESEGADDGDLRVATLAFLRKETGQNVRLISNDHCFHNTHYLFENHEITIRDRKKEKDTLIQVNN